MSASAPEPYQVTFENEFVRIVHVTLTLGQRPPRYDPSAIATVRIDLNSGATYYTEGPMPEDAAHLLTQTLREIRVELKSAPHADPLALDAVRIDPARYLVDFENDRVRVVRLRFAPREKGVMVTHPPRVLATLTDVSVKLLFQDGRTDARGALAGVAAWLDTETLQTENAGDQSLEVILVEPKSPAGF